jgi:hypothetical protein
MNLNTLLVQADSLRFKLLGLVGNDVGKKNKIVEYLGDDGWKLIDVESELLPIRAELDASGDERIFEIGTRVKEWFNTQPDKLILTNASILYHEMFVKISPVGAFKYNSRNKNCVLFMEDEERLGKRIYHGKMGTDDYYDQEINDIIIANLDDIKDDFTKPIRKREIITDKSKLPADAIGHLFDFQQIKDVVDIDADLDESDKRADVVASYVISESLENQIVEFFNNLENPKHKANTVIGNYGSGKSHLIAFLISLVEDPNLADSLKNEPIKRAVKKLKRKFFSVQFELQAGQVGLKQWFYGKIKQQLKAKYNIDIPVCDPQKDYDDKDNIKDILSIIKKEDPSIGLLVVIDEISDFLSSKQQQEMKADLQFLRVIGQVCQDQDLMFVGSMQEDVFTSNKFKNVASELGRIGERFQNIIIHKEDIKKVIANRIVAKNQEQRHNLEQKLIPYAEKIDHVSSNVDEYVDLFPLTPFLLELFSDLPYFEKRGVIQFAMSEIKYLLAENFPYFITFEKVYDILENNPNKKNLEEIYDITKVMAILGQKINLLDSKFQEDALKVVKGLAVYSLWDRRDKGATAQELANNLMLLPQKKLFSAADNISLIIKKIRDVTDGEYIKTSKDESTGLEYFRFVTKAGVDPDQKISQKAASVSDSQVEFELMMQLADILELENVDGQSDVFKDECEWTSTKSFRTGYVVFVKNNSTFSKLTKRDYAVVIQSPFVKDFKESFADNQLTIKLQLNKHENVELLKEIVAIKELRDSNFQKSLMSKKLQDRINGYTMGATTVTGLKYRLAKLLTNTTDCHLNGNLVSIKTHLGRERKSIPEIIDVLKTSVFDELFNKSYPQHPIYSIQLSATNILSSLNSIVADIIKGNFNNLSRATVLFLQNLDLLDSQEYPSVSGSKITAKILDVLKANAKKVTDIEKEIVQPLCSSSYGLEPQIVHFHLVLLTVLGKTYLQAKGGDKIDINNINEKIKNIAAFETIAYARIQEDYSYDFAARLLNALNLNGNKITLEKERLTSFKEYKEKIASIMSAVKSLEGMINDLANRQTLHLEIDQIKKEFSVIESINWQELNINNHTQFSNVEALNLDLSKITLVLLELKNITDAIAEYQDTVHEAIQYMNSAVELLEDTAWLVTDHDKFNTLKDYQSDVGLLCLDFPKFKDRSLRNPIKGKIQQFVKSYVYDFYYPAHEKYVGKKVDWSSLNSYPSNTLYKKLVLLNNITCISETAFRQMVLSWTDLEQFKCSCHDLTDTLNNHVRCQKCFFPKKNTNYNEKLAVLNKMDQDIEDLYNSYEKTIVKEVRSYRDNIQYLSEEAEKRIVQGIIDTKTLPSEINQRTVTVVNKLFKEIDVVEVEQSQIIDTLFPSQEMTTLEELRKRFYALEADLKKDKQETEVRIKLK